MVFVQLAEAGSLGGGMLSYFASSSSCTLRSTAFASLFLRLNFLLSTAVENTDSLSGCFSTGLGVTSALGVTEKLGALGPFGLA